jgi:hypothetical protein
MVQRGEDLGLSLESPQSLRFPGELIGQDLDRHVPTQLPVSRPIHLSHPALADGLEDLVVGEFVASLEGHGPVMLRRIVPGVGALGPFAPEPLSGPDGRDGGEVVDLDRLSGLD